MKKYIGTKTVLAKPIDRIAVSMLDFVDSNHCLKSIDWKVGQTK